MLRRRKNVQPVGSAPAFGPGLLTLTRGPNEYIFMERIIQVSRIYALSALEYLDSGSRGGMT